MGKPFLEMVVYEVAYAGGYRFLDRCGQAMLDIENLGDWIPAEAKPSGGAMVRLDRGMTFAFNTRTMSLTHRDADDPSLLEEEFPRLFRTILADFGIKTLLRFGVRFVYLFGKTSLEDASRSLQKLGLFSFSEKARAVLSDPRDVEFAATFGSTEQGERLIARAVQREKGEIPGEYLSLMPGKLPNNQKEALRLKLQEEAKYRKDPRFAVQCDLDVYRLQPSVEDLVEFWQHAMKRSQAVLDLFGGKK